MELRVTTIGAELHFNKMAGQWFFPLQTKRLNALLRAVFWSAVEAAL